MSNREENLIPFENDLQIWRTEKSEAKWYPVEIHAHCCCGILLELGCGFPTKDQLL